MPRFKFFGISEADAEIKSADAAINPLLTAANITTIEVNGSPKPATSDDIPLALKITALSATHKAGNGDEQMNQILANNKILAAQAKELSTKLASVETSAATLTGENATLIERNEVLNGSIKTLTASNAELTNLRAAAVDEAGRVTAQINGLNSEISRMCLSVSCLTDLKDAKGKLLPSSASSQEREAAADLIPAADKLKAFSGAVNMAMLRTGVSAKDMPHVGAGGQNTPTGHAILGQYDAITNASEKTAFYRNNKEAIDAAYRAKNS